MYTFTVHTLVDITDNGVLKGDFPFKTKANELVHNKESLFTARNQNSNFATLLQVLQMRGNIVWETPPEKTHDLIANTKFGTTYEKGKHTSWKFTFQVEQEDLYGDTSTKNVGDLVEDFNLIPIMTFCKETATSPSNTFITEDDRTINTYITYDGFQNK